MKLKRPLFGPQNPRGPSRGSDVVAVKRGLSKVEGDFFPRPAAGFDDIYNAKTVEAVKVFQRLNGIVPISGNFGQATLDDLWSYMDAYARYLYWRFKVPSPPPTTKLVEPYQGFSSLDGRLWEAYSIGRNLGLGDGPGLASGTYNGASTLPGGGKSDHAYNPSFAFDLDIGPDTGWANPTAQAFFHKMVSRPEIAYVILGDKIWSASRASEGIRAYTSGGHLNHVHVSGVH